VTPLGPAAADAWGPAGGGAPGPQTRGYAGPPAASGYPGSSEPGWPPDLGDMSWPRWDGPPPVMHPDHPSAPVPRVRISPADAPGGSPGSFPGIPATPPGGSSRLPQRKPGNRANPGNRAPRANPPGRASGPAQAYNPGPGYDSGQYVLSFVDLADSCSAVWIEGDEEEGRE